MGGGIKPAERLQYIRPGVAHGTLHFDPGDAARFRPILHGFCRDFEAFGDFELGEEFVCIGVYRGVHGSWIYGLRCGKFA